MIFQNLRGFKNLKGWYPQRQLLGVLPSSDTNHNDQIAAEDLWTL
ncbi:hypothetical protein B879_00558 [Cecembia lonarensis LW9]|uniref:Uncharacterized protein n=1 Tax=Cecembia lonarensis (strain CCUG 58316 / KCTC 22772 / LW9) TaxID=1225176 RepID=K1LKF2_CECL9|nr:hypothetical protein B879_00558 [Cecembia lonarensis LW9]